MHKERWVVKRNLLWGIGRRLFLDFTPMLISDNKVICLNNWFRRPDCWWLFNDRSPFENFLTKFWLLIENVFRIFQRSSKHAVEDDDSSDSSSELFNNCNVVTLLSCLSWLFVDIHERKNVSKQVLHEGVFEILEVHELVVVIDPNCLYLLR